MRQERELLNVDAAILSVAQLIQPCKSDGLATRAKDMLREVSLTKGQISTRIKALLETGYLWSRSDEFLLLTPKGYDVSRASLPPKERDKFRLLLLNKARYK